MAARLPARCRKMIDFACDSLNSLQKKYIWLELIESYYTYDYSNYVIDSFDSFVLLLLLLRKDVEL